MSRQVKENVQIAVKDLIKHVAGFDEGTVEFNHVQRHILGTLKKADTMYFLNKRQVDENIAGMSEKFVFHGFFSQAKTLQDSYKQYVWEHLPKSELNTRLNVVKFLLCMSERPTSAFHEKPEEFQTEASEEEEEIDWGAYLKEGITPWMPSLEETSESSDGESIVQGDTCGGGGGKDVGACRLPVVIEDVEKGTVTDLRTIREELLATIQPPWWGRERFVMPPYSDWREANIGLLWDRYLEDEALGLVPIDKANVLSEYKVMRETLWQMWSLHTSTVYELVGDRVKPRTNVTISSVRSETLENFLQEFIPYMEALEFFRDFSSSLDIVSEECLFTQPQTYRSYDEALQSIIQPVYVKLSQVEDKVREQDTTYTLLNLARDLEAILEPVLLLRKIHTEVVIDFKRNSSFKCATTLLSRLHNSFQFTSSKLEQDLRVTLFLGSLRHYFALVDSWLMKNDLSDYSEEFPITNKNKSLYMTGDGDGDGNSSWTDSGECDKWKLKFELRDGLDHFCRSNSVMRIITETVLPVGRNIHFLRSLNTFAHVNDSNESIHEEFQRKCLTELCRFFDVNAEDVYEQKCVDVEDVPYKVKYPVVCTEDTKRPTEMDQLENLVDTSDGFLMVAFKDFFVDDKRTPTPAKPATVFEKVSTITKTMFPTANFFENILNSIIKERFTISGLMVKNILVEKYSLEKQFQFLRHMFLFADDLIFPFYRRLFEKTDSSGANWGNEAWLTSYLQDIFVDAYPEFCENCHVHVDEHWRRCLDSLKACGAITVQYEIQWPLDIIINSGHVSLYKALFHFILRVKWALYTLNHLAFADLESKRARSGRQAKSLVMKLKILRFSLINLLNSVQHYVFSFAYTKCLQEFEVSFERASDLSSIMVSHSNFINTVYSMVTDVRNAGERHGVFDNILEIVKQLKAMWNNVEHRAPDRLNDCYVVYKRCFQTLDPIVRPVYIFDY